MKKPFLFIFDKEEVLMKKPFLFIFDKEEVLTHPLSSIKRALLVSKLSRMLNAESSPNSMYWSLETTNHRTLQSVFLMFCVKLKGMKSAELRIWQRALNLVSSLGLLEEVLVCRKKRCNLNYVCYVTKESSISSVFVYKK